MVNRCTLVGMGLLTGSLFTCACRQDLLPGEYVVPGDVAAEVWEGGAGSRFGSSVALGPLGLAASAPGSGDLFALPQGMVWSGPEGTGAWTWWGREGAPCAARARDGVWCASGPDSALVREVEDPNGLAFDAGETDLGWMTAVAVPDGLDLFPEGSEGFHVPCVGVRRVAVGAGRILGIRCGADGCVAVAWSLDGAGEVTLGPAGADGDIRELAGVAWWGDPESEDELGRGWVASERGDGVQGEPGDHLGRAIADGFAAGVFNRSLDVPRVRVVSLVGGAGFAIDRAVETHPVALASFERRLAVGVPSFAREAPEVGRVLMVDLGEIGGIW